MMYPRGAAFSFLFAICAVAIVSVIAAPSAPPSSCPEAIGSVIGDVPSLLSPPALAVYPTTCLSSGSQAWVNNLGSFTYEPVCQCQTGVGVSCIAASSDGGAGPDCWEANLNGTVGANYITQWYVDSVNGNDCNDCQASGAAVVSCGHGACNDLAEVLRRIGDQYIYEQVYVNLSGNFASRSYVIRTRGYPLSGTYGNLVIAGTRTCVPGYTLTSYTPWNGATNQEGTAYVTADAGFDAAALNTANGYILEDETAPHAGLGILIGVSVDAGTFLTPGGVTVGAYVQSEPATGDALSLCTLTQMSTATGTTMEILDDGPEWENIQMGAIAGNSIEIAANPAYNFGMYFDSCIIRASQTQDGTAPTNSYGSAWLKYAGYGRLWAIGSLFDRIAVEDHGFVELNTNNLVGATPGGAWVSVSGRDGPAWFEVSGPTAVASYSVPCVSVDGRATMFTVAAPYGLPQFWCRNGYPGIPAFQVYSGSMVLYPAGYPPAVVGTSTASPYVIGGAYYDGGSLPQFNLANGAGIVVHQ